MTFKRIACIILSSLFQTEKSRHRQKYLLPRLAHGDLDDVRCRTPQYENRIYLHRSGCSVSQNRASRFPIPEPPGEAARSPSTHHTQPLCYGYGAKQTAAQDRPGRHRLDDNAADLAAPEQDAVCLTAVYGLFYSFTGDDLPIFLKMFISPPELLQSAKIKSLLIIKDKLLSVLWLKWYEFHFFVRHILFPRFHGATRNYTLEVHFVESKLANFRKLQISYRQILRYFKENSSMILEHLLLQEKTYESQSNSTILRGIP